MHKQKLISMDKYYIPEIGEFHVGFEYFENETLVISDGTEIEKFVFRGISKGIKVKYLDKEDIENLGFNDRKQYEKNGGLLGQNVFCKIKKNEIFKIDAYWSYQRLERENLIRIFKGDLYNYPYQEIFRGDIKNKSELKKLLKQLNIK